MARRTTEYCVEGVVNIGQEDYKILCRGDVNIGQADYSTEYYVEGGVNIGQEDYRILCRRRREYWTGGLKNIV